MSRLGFELQKEAPGSQARAGRFKTLHNEVLTPLFMPVGTHATVRGQRQENLLESGSQILLANTYHLYLRPGPEVFKHFGGIHKFMNWPRSVLTDSGGFQIFAMAKDVKMSEEGARFLSYVDGKHILLTPELSIETQKAIGSDIMMVLDQCIPSTAPKAEALAAMRLTERWAKRSLAARGDSPQSMFGIVQGACYLDLRKESVERTCELPMDGFALGGLAVGETKQEREDVAAYTTSLMPKNYPRYLMGVGTPIDLLEAVHRGVDMFDCIMPTAFAQQGTAFTSRGKVSMRRSVHKFTETALDPECDCFTCKTFSRAYLHHLVKAGEVIAWQWIGIHNIHFYHRLMSRMREAILAGTFLELYNSLREPLARGDEDHPVKIPLTNKNKGPPLELGNFEIVVGENVAHVKQKSSGEIMHPLEDPLNEARTLYVAQSQIIERLQAEEKPLVLWDVGMGAATNAMATVFSYLEAESKGQTLAPLQIESFEKDLDSLRLVSRHPQIFNHVRHGAPYKILASGSWKHSNDRLQWRLLEGDFFEQHKQAAAPDIIFFDPFSHRVDEEFWTPETFALLYKICEGRDVQLFTYSSSTRVRAELLAAGFFVARGLGSGFKRETTIALTPQAAVRHAGIDYLGSEWIERLEKSSAPISTKVRESVGAHPQFVK